MEKRYPRIALLSGATSTLRKGLIFCGLVISAMAHGVSYQSWLSEHFEETEIAQVELQATLWGLEADPDHDGRKNLLEYALGSDPRSSQASDFGITLELVSEGGQPIIPRMRFRQRTDDQALSYELEVSDDLQLWQTGEHWVPLMTANLPNEPFQAVTYEYRDPAGLGEARFFRLRVLLSDSDGDGLPDDYEEQIIAASLADSDPSNDRFTVVQVLAEADFDGDGLSNRDEFDLNLNATVDERAELGLRYTYDAINRLTGASGAPVSVSYTFDAEGNMLNAQ